MQIFVKDDKTYLLNVTKSLRVSSLVNMIRAKLNIGDEFYIQLYYAGKPLQPNLYVGEFNITKNSTLFFNITPK